MLCFIIGLISTAIGWGLLLFSTDITLTDLAFRPFLVGGGICIVVGLWQIIAKRKSDNQN